MFPTTRTSARSAIALGCTLGMALQVAQADVTIEERISVKGAGMMSMANMSGRSVTTISGDRARMESDMKMQSRLARMVARDVGESVEIVRLDEDKIYSLDLKRKQYTEQTFGEMRAKLEKAMQQSRQAGQSTPGPIDESQCEWTDAKADVKKTGERATVAGFDAERVTVTASQSCKQKTSGQVCEYALSLDQWLTPSVPGGDDALAFHKAYAQKMGFDAAASKDVAQRAEAMFGRYEGAWKELAGKMGEVEGYPVRSSFALAIGGPQCKGASDMRNAAAQDAPSGADAQSAAAEAAGQAAGQAAAESAGRSAVGGIAGALGGRIAGSMLGRRRQQQKEQEQAAEPEQQTTAATAVPGAPAAESGMVPFITVSSEIVSVSTAPAEKTAFEIPAGFRKVSESD